MNLTQNYGWRSGQGATLCGYVARAVLESGAGNGALCRAMVASGYELIDAEPNAAGVTIVKHQCPRARFDQLSVADGPHPTLSDYAATGGVNVVVSTEVIQHFYFPRRLPELAYTVLRERGHLVLSTPYHDSLKNLAVALLGNRDWHADPLDISSCSAAARSLVFWRRAEFASSALTVSGEFLACGKACLS